MKLVSWNVNGLRAVLKRNFLEFLEEENPDVLCLQETKATPDQVEQLWPAHYTTYWNSAQKKGYSGVGIYTRHEPTDVRVGYGHRADSGSSYLISLRAASQGTDVDIRIEDPGVSRRHCEVRADGVLLPCEPASELPMAQRYFLF